MKEAGNWTAIGDTSKNIPRTTEWEMAELLTEECPILLVSRLYPCFSILRFTIKTHDKPGLGRNGGDRESWPASPKQRWKTRGWMLSAAAVTLAHLMLITLAKLYSKTQMDKHFTAFFKTVLGEIASHCMLV